MWWVFSWHYENFSNFSILATHEKKIPWVRVLLKYIHKSTTINIFKNICTFYLLLCYLFVISFHRLYNFLKKAYHVYFIFEENVKEIIWSLYFYAIWTWPNVWNVIRRSTFTDRLKLELCKKSFQVIFYIHCIF